MVPGVPKDLVQSLHKTYRAIFPATPMMKELYKHVHVVTVDEHALCDRLAISHPLPLARIVVIRGGQHGICRTSKPGLYCGFMPTHPFRLILDGLCGGSICRTCTSPQILSPFAETLVLHLQHDPFGRDCRSRNLPRDFHPKRLVLLFPQERVDKFKDFDYQYGDRWGMRERKDASALGPGDGGKALENVFYRIALMCLLVDNDCKIYVVAADQAALHLKGLERFETSLEECRPMAPEPQKPIHQSQRFPLPAGAFWVLDSEGVEATRWMDRRGGVHHIDEILEYRDDVKTDFHLMMEDPLSQGYALPAGAHWILDNDQVEATRWLDKYGQGHHIEEIYKCRYDYDDMQGSDRWRGQSGSDINPCYSQDGQVVSCICPRRIPPALLPVAENIIQKRVSAIEALVHKWLDFILDSKMPLEHWEDEKDSLDENGLKKWDNRHQFERHLHNLKAKRDQKKKNQEWHNNHMCWAGCRDDYKPEVPESEDEDEDGNVIREDRNNVWTDYGRPWEARLGDGSKRIVEPKRWRRGQKFAKTREELEAIRKIKHGRIQFISTHEYHKMEGNNDEMDDPSKYL